MAAKLYDLDSGIDPSACVMDGDELGSTFFSMFEPREDVQRKQSEKREKLLSAKKKEKSLAEQRKRDSGVVDKPREYLLDTSFPPSCDLHPNPSAFNVFANIRTCVLERRAKEALNLIRKQRRLLEEESESDEELELHDDEPPAKIPRVVGMGLSSVFELIKETREAYPDLCQRALQALFDTLQGQRPEGMSKEPTDVIETLYNLLMELATNVSSRDKDLPLTSLACSCLLSLVVAVGDTYKMLNAVSALLMSNPMLITQQIQMPEIMSCLQKSIQAVLLGRTQIPAWFSRGIKESALLSTIRQVEGIKGVKCPYSAVASDGKYLYIHSSKGLFKLGSGFDGSIEGHIYTRRENFHNKEKGWLCYAQGTLFYQNMEDSASSVVSVNSNTLADEKTFKLQDTPTGPHCMFSDGTMLGQIYPAKDDTFVAKMYLPTKSPMSSVSEVPLRLSQKCLDFCGQSMFDEEQALQTMQTGFESEILEVGSVKDIALARTANGKLLFTGKPSFMGIKSTGPTPGKWLELSIPKAPRVAHFSVGHDTAHAIIVSDSGIPFFVGTAKRGEDADINPNTFKPRRQVKGTKPRVMGRMNGKKVVASGCGDQVSALVTDKGELYMFGRDLNFADETTGLISNLKDVFITRVALGKAHTVALTDKGEVYAFGVNNKGQCGREYSPARTREAIRRARAEGDEGLGMYECPPGMHRWKHNKCMICVACGECTGYGVECVSGRESDRIPGTPCGCGLGDSGCGECGICRRCAVDMRNMDEPYQLMEYLALRDSPYSIPDLPFDMVMAMNPRTIDILKKGMDPHMMRKLRKFRPRAAYALGDYEDPKATSVPPGQTVIGDGSVKAIQVACGLAHSAVLLENGHVYTFGNNNNGQLGLGDTTIRGTPTRVELDVPVLQVACGSYHTVLMTSDGRVWTFGSNTKGELGRHLPETGEDGRKLITSMSYTPDFIPGLGPKNRRACWISASGSRNFIGVYELIVSESTLPQCKVFANQSCIGIVPKDHPTVKCVMVNRSNAEYKIFMDNDQLRLDTSCLCMDPVYSNLWSYDPGRREIRCYDVIQSAVRSGARDLNMTLTPGIAVPVRSSARVTRSQSALFLLSVLDTLAKAKDLNLDVEGQKKDTGEKKIYSPEDFQTVNRFESHGGGWGYSGHSVEGIRFSPDTDCLLGGVGLFGGRGEYFAKIKLYELGTEGGDNEIEGVLISETEEFTYVCAVREKYPLMFDEPIKLQADNWYVVTAKVSGPSSDCGASGQSMVTTDDQVVFKFKTSRKSNNGTDTNAGQIPLLYYKLLTPESSSSQDSDGTSELAHLLTKDFSKDVTPECFDSLLNLLNWAWSTFNGSIQDMQILSGSQLKAMTVDLKRLVYVCTACLHLLTSFICKVYPKTGHAKKLGGETARMADCVCDTRAAVHCILAEHIPLPPVKVTVSQGVKEHTRLAEGILQACHRMFTMCFHAFYPTGSLKWLCLCDLISSTNQQDEDLGGCAQQLAAVMDALSQPSVKLMSILPINSDHGKVPYLHKFSKQGDKRPSSEVHQYPVLVEQMFARTEMEGGTSTQCSFKEVLDRLIHMVTLPAKQTLRGEQTTYPDNLISSTCALLIAIIQELSASATWMEADLTSASRPLLTTPNRFTRTSSNAFWNAGNGNPDAVTFTVDKPGIVIAGVTVFGGTGRYDYELEILDDRSDAGQGGPHTQRWNSLGSVKGVYNSEDTVGDVVELKLEQPVPIKEGVKYAFRLRNNGTKTLNGDGGMGKVKCADGTTFTFSACSLSTNGTNHTRGQLPQILYYSAPESEDEETRRQYVQYQSRKNAVTIASSVIRGAADILVRAQSLQDEKKLLARLASTHLFSSLLPMVLAYVGPVACEDPRSAVHVLTLIQHIMPPVVTLCMNAGAQPGPQSSFAGDGGVDLSTTAQHYAVVESDHPYKPSTITSYKVTFPDVVKWMTIEFDPQSATAQPEDYLYLYVPVKASLQPKMTSSTDDLQQFRSQWKVLQKFTGSNTWQRKVSVVPGNELTFSLETASDYAKNDKASSYGFKCAVFGYEWTNKTMEGILLLEKELSYLGGMCAAAIMSKEIGLPTASSEELEEDLFMVEKGAKKIFQEHKTLLSKGFALSQPPTVTQALEGTLPLDIHSSERSFLQDFIAGAKNTTGGRLARWLQPEPRLDPRQCELIYNKDELRSNWPCSVTIQLRDQYCNPVNVPNVKVQVKAVPMEKRDGDGGRTEEPMPVDLGGSVLYGGHSVPNVSVPYQMTIRENKDRFHAITMMPEYENYSFEELRFTSPGSRRPSENMLVRPNHDGTVLANWTPSRAGWYNIHAIIDGYSMGEIYRVEVKDPPAGVYPPSQSQITKQANKPKKLRKFVADYSAGLRVRLSPSLQAEKIGIILPNGIIEYVDELQNDDGVWLQLSPESTKLWCSNGYAEAWCLQYNQALGKTLMVAAEEPKSLMDEMVKKAMNTVTPELVQPPAKYQSDKIKDGSGIYVVVNCGASGHNIRSNTDLGSAPVGKVLKGNKVVAKRLINSSAGLWMELSPESVLEYCPDKGSSGFVLVHTKDKKKIFLRHASELDEPSNSEPRGASGEGFVFSDPSAMDASTYPDDLRQPASFPGSASLFPFGKPSTESFVSPFGSASPLPERSESPDPFKLPKEALIMKPFQVSSDDKPMREDSRPDGMNTKDVIKAIGQALWKATSGSPGSTPPGSPRKSSRSSSPRSASDKSMDYRRQSTSEWVTPPSTPPMSTTPPRFGSTPPLTPPVMRSSSPMLKDSDLGDPLVLGKDESRERSPKGSPIRRISRSPRHGSPAKGDVRLFRESSPSPSRTAATQTSPPEPPVSRFSIGYSGAPKKEDSARMSPKLSRKSSRSQSLRSKREGRSSSPVPPQKPSSLKPAVASQPKPVTTAMTPSVAECLRTVFAAFLWHEGIVHDAMACASFLKFHPNLAKEMPTSDVFVFDKPGPQPGVSGSGGIGDKNSSGDAAGIQVEDTSPKHGGGKKSVHFNINLPPEPERTKKERHKSEKSVLTKVASFDQSSPPASPTSSRRSELLPTLKHLVFFWECMSSATIRIIQEKSITESPALDIYKPQEDRYDMERMMMERREMMMIGMRFGEMPRHFPGINQENQTMCDLCGGMYPHPVTYHMRKHHYGCGKPAGGQGYNSGGIFCGGWAGNCGDGGQGQSTWYLICHQCRDKYVSERRTLFPPKEPDMKMKRQQRKVGQPALEAHQIMMNNALFLLNLTSSAGVHFSSSKSPDAIMSALTRTDSYLPSVSDEFLFLEQTPFPLVPFQYLSQRGADDADSAFNEEVIVAQGEDKIQTIKAESLGPGVGAYQMRKRLQQAYQAGLFDPAKEIHSPTTSPRRGHTNDEPSSKGAMLTRSVSELRPGVEQGDASSCIGFDIMGNTHRKGSVRRRNISGDSGLSLLKNPSCAMSNLIKATDKGGRHKTMSDKAMQRPVMAFVMQHHELGNLQLAMRQAIRKAALRVYGLQALNWLVRTVTQPQCMHDLLWFFVKAFTPLYPETSDEEKENKKDKREQLKEKELYSWLSVCDHPKQDITLAGDSVQLLETNFHDFLQTVSDAMMYLPTGSPLQQMAVRCWSFRFKPSDHQFLHKSHVFNNISKIMSKAEAEEEEHNGVDSNLKGHAPGNSSKMSIKPEVEGEGSDGSDYVGLLVECLRDITPGADMEVSSRQVMTSSLRDNSTETFWESGDEDKNKTKVISVAVSVRMIPRVFCIHIDNTRDVGNKVTSVMFSVGPSWDEVIPNYHEVDLDARHAGWVTCFVTDPQNRACKMNLRGPDNTLRARQVKVIGMRKGESSIVDKQFNKMAADRKKCESETLRVFRLLTSEVFGRLISDKSEDPLFARTDSKEDLDGMAGETETNLKEHMVGILFSRKGMTLTHLQKQVCEHIVEAIRKETSHVKEEWEELVKSHDPSLIDDSRTSDAYCFELLSMVLALSGSQVGRTYLAQQQELLQDLVTLLHTGTPRLQRQVTSLLRRVLPEVLPQTFARNLRIHTLPAKDVSVLSDVQGFYPAQFNPYLQRILDVFLACIAKGLTVQVKSKKEISSITLLDSPIRAAPNDQRWYLKGSITEKMTTEIVNLLKDMASGQLSQEWAEVTKAAIAESILNLTKLEEDQRSSAECIQIPTLWLALGALCVLDPDHTEKLSSGQWVKSDGSPGTPMPTCDNHDDGNTLAIIKCVECGNLCADCDRFLHLPKTKRAHQRQIFKDEEESIKVDLHEGCGRTKLFWILALADSKTLKALVEFREGAKNNAKPLPYATGTCRFCGTTGNTGLLAVGNVCSDPDCQEYAQNACFKTLPCGHLCGGIKDEEICLPCLQGCAKDSTLKQDADDMCMICFTEALNAAPAIQLECGHVFHLHCTRNILSKRWVGPRITFGFSQCPICKVTIDHPVLKDLLDPIRVLQEDVRRKALMRLEYEGLHKCDAIKDSGGRFYNDPAGFAIERYSYYVCFKCGKAYYGGEARCDEEAGISDDYNPSELVCGGCSDVSRAQMCPKHGMDFLEYKCRYCCSVAVFFCFGTTHFCNMCHDDFQRVTNLPKLMLPHCPAGPRGRQLEGDECPLHVQHPPTGEEFALGCGVCRNAHTF